MQINWITVCKCDAFNSDPREIGFEAFDFP